MSVLTTTICSLLISALQPLQACLETAWTRGYLYPATPLDDSVTLKEGRGYSCVCCAYCNKIPACASLNYNVITRECRLYDFIANYSSIIGHSDWRYYVMPKRSRHLEFCREDSDCLNDLTCRGRICTDRTAITCRVIYEELGAGARLGTHIKVHGWLNEQDVDLQCRMHQEWPGFTRVFRNYRGSGTLTRDNIRNRNSHNTGPVHSSLELADDIRQLRDDDTYEMRTIAKCSGDGEFSAHHLIQSAHIQRSQPVLVDIPTDTPIRDTFQEDFAGIPALSLPYLLPSGEDILGVKVNVIMEDGSHEQVALPLARTDQRLWFNAISIYIRE